MSLCLLQGMSSNLGVKHILFRESTITSQETVRIYHTSEVDMMREEETLNYMIADGVEVQGAETGSDR